MTHIISIETGEILKKYNDFDHRWYDEGKRRVKREIKESGREFVKVEFDKSGTWVYVKEVRI